jgi:hypothetical protein
MANKTRWVIGYVYQKIGFGCVAKGVGVVEKNDGDSVLQ